jgi:hypothetical protein
MAGKVTLHSGNFRIVDDSTIPDTLDNSGNVTVNAGVTLDVREYVDRPPAILDGDGTLKTERITRTQE